VLKDLELKTFVIFSFVMHFTAEPHVGLHPTLPDRQVFLPAVKLKAIRTLMGVSRCFDHFTNIVLKPCKLQLIYPLALELHVPSIRVNSA
jgi:hypothetical protein